MKHVLVKTQAICETAFFIESLDETTRLAFRDIDCAGCLRQALTAAEQRVQVLSDLLTKVEAVAADCPDAANATIDRYVNKVVP